MNTTKATICAATLALGLMAWACQKSDSVATFNPKDNIPIAYIDADGSHESLTRDTARNRYPHMKMTGGEMTLNDKCPVRKAGLNLRLPVLFVNGKPIGFC